MNAATLFGLCAAREEGEIIEAQEIVHQMLLAANNAGLPELDGRTPDWVELYNGTTNAIERLFVEVRRRTRPMGVFSDRTSMERILFAVFTHENRKEGTATLFLLAPEPMGLAEGRLRGQGRP